MSTKRPRLYGVFGDEGCEGWYVATSADAALRQFRRATGTSSEDTEGFYARPVCVTETAGLPRRELLAWIAGFAAGEEAAEEFARAEELVAQVTDQRLRARGVPR